VALVVVLALAISIALVPATTVGAARPFPPPRGELSDFAGVVEPAWADSITMLAAEVRQKTGAELAVVTLADLGGETIDPVAVALFAQWGVGRTGQDDGVLVLLAVAERRVRIEVGYGLEGALPDGRSGDIIRRVMAPSLATGRYGEGLLAGARAVAGVIAVERGVTITGSIAPRRLQARRDSKGPPVGQILFLLLIVFLSLARVARRLRGGSDGNSRRRRRGWHDPWGGFGGGFGGMGGFGGGFGGGGGGGGFGGFGGGRSGGGGASGGF
jgi:uncharacterized protein